MMQRVQKMVSNYDNRGYISILFANNYPSMEGRSTDIIEVNKLDSNKRMTDLYLL